MDIETCEALVVDEHGALSFEQLIQCSGMTEADLRELVEYGALAPLDPVSPSWIFPADMLPIARSAGRLRREFDLDLHGVSVLLRFLERIAELETELRAVRAGVAIRVPRRQV